VAQAQQTKPNILVIFGDDIGQTNVSAYSQTMAVWFEPLVPLRGMKMFDLRADPYERADITSNTYFDWLIDRAFIIYGAQAGVAEFLATFKEFPPSQRAATFGIDQAMEKMKQGIGGN
jgi:arylsulfatase